MIRPISIETTENVNTAIKILTRINAKNTNTQLTSSSENLIPNEESNKTSSYRKERILRQRMLSN